MARSRPRGAAPVLIDCDPGVDDALALALALASPELDLVAVTTVHGNVPVRWSYRNARRLLLFFGGFLEDPRPLPPVHRGAPGPLAGGRVDRRVSAAIHGRGGLGELFAGARKPPRPARAQPEPAERVIAERARRLGRALTLVFLGPLTNLARAWRRDPGALARVGRIVIMGGAAAMPGNATPAAEFNIHCDPEAAAEVFARGAPVTLVGLDVTRRAVLPGEALRGGGPFRAGLRDLCRTYADFNRRRRGIDGITLHDPLAVAVAIAPGLVRCERLPVAVECGRGPARGMTVVDLRARGERPRGPAADVALEVDARRFLRFFLGRMGRFRGWS